MATQDTWTIEGYRGRHVPNRFFHVGDGERENDGLAVILPGIRYTNDAPLLYYARKLLLEQQQSDVLAVDYGYGFDRRFQEAPADAREQWMRTDMEALIAAINGRQQYRRLTLVTKSLGTIIATRMLASGISHDTRLVWLTPVLSDTGVAGALREAESPSMVVIGTEDRYYDAGILSDLGQTDSVKVLEMEGADHRLEVQGDALRSLDILGQYVRELDSFLQSGFAS
jgi:pimeloyl-ACP methyl ester carboxylesterase